MPVDPREIVRECPWSHAVNGPCTNLVATYQMAGRDGPLSIGTRCSTCHQWVAPAGVAATHDRMGDPIPAAEAPPTAAEREAQAARCHTNCARPDPDACPCQTIPDAETVAARIEEEECSMAETKWTEGEWRAHPDDFGTCNGSVHYTGVTAGSQTVCMVVAFDRGEVPEHRANAHLIAAAPALYRALEVTRQHLALFCGPDDDIANAVFKVADDALSAARGESHE